jgi:phospholipid/cholesterol/gamma-HCH transport system substrate-binding protein
MKPLAYIVATLLVLGGAGLGYNAMRDKKDTYEVVAYFEKAIGLFPNSDVDILGVEVGKVKTVTPEGNRVKVTMVIDSKYKVPDSSETFAQIVPISVISDRYIQLAPVYQGGPALADGAVLDTDQTQIPAELDDVFRQLKKLLDAIEPGKAGEPGALGALVVELNKTLKDREQDLQGTLINAAELTGTLSDARGSISGLLTNLDDIFGTLSTRTAALGQLNKNFALVMTALAESRSDLEGTLANLGRLTNDVGSLVEQHGDRLAGDLKLVTNITSVILKNRNSFIESLAWLPVVGQGAAKAYHPGPNKDIDVRDNATQRVQCSILDDLPDSPVKDALQQFCRDNSGEPRNPPQPGPGPKTAGNNDAPTLADVAAVLNCDRGVRKVRHQLKRIERIGLPAEATQQLIKPMRHQLRLLKKKCKEFGQELGDTSGLLDQLPGLLDGPPAVDPNDPTGLGGLTGTAAGSFVAPEPEPGFWTKTGDWFSGFFGFMGVGS